MLFIASVVYVTNLVLPQSSHYIETVTETSAGHYTGSDGSLRRTLTFMSDQPNSARRLVDMIVLSYHHLLVLILITSLAFLFPYFFPSSRQDFNLDMAATTPLKFLTVAAKAKHTATVIFVHVSAYPCPYFVPDLQMFGTRARLTGRMDC